MLSLKIVKYIFFSKVAGMEQKCPKKLVQPIEKKSVIEKKNHESLIRSVPMKEKENMCIKKKKKPGQTPIF